jgi:hypothetical protein
MSEIPEPKAPHPFLLAGRGPRPDPVVWSAADWSRHRTEFGVGSLYFCGVDAQNGCRFALWLFSRRSHRR